VILIVLPLIVPVRDRSTAAKRVIAKRRLPVPRHDELGTIQELGTVQERPGEVGAVEYGFEEVRPLQVGSRQIRIAAFRSPQIGASQVRPSNRLRSSPRRAARDRSGAPSCSARHAFHATAPRLSKVTCSPAAIFHPRQTVGQLRSDIAMRPIELSQRQSFSATQIGTGQVRAVEPYQA
jgi:hypothetical protein